MRVGIPRALLYYYEKDMWKYFFEKLHVDIILSDKTTKKTISDGEELAVDEACLSLKIFLGHVKNLKGKCDAILIPRLFSIKSHEEVCTNFNALYDLIYNLFPDCKLINYNIDLRKGKNEVMAYTKVGSSLGFSYIDSFNAYCYAKRRVKEIKKERFLEQEKKLSSNKIKILCSGHPYNLYDDMLGGEINKFLREHDVEIIFSDLLDDSLVDDNAKVLSKEVHWTHNKKVMAACYYYGKSVDGIILISSFPCGPDSLTNEMIKRKMNIPILNVQKESASSTGLITRLEAFLDLLEVKQCSR
ncbi:MAG: hypothetical protein J6B89_01265 [Bacilli bacterium]|nr:hypothetical protein [Bacilli bacterium]